MNETPDRTMSAEMRDRLSGKRIVASVSGGKDSAAMSLWLTEQGVEHDRVFCDTGWEHDLTYEYLRGPLEAVLGPITWLHPKRKMEELIRYKETFPLRTQRFCTQELKVFPIQRHIKALTETGEDVVNVVGIRAAESTSRAKLPEWEYLDGFDCDAWRPLLQWSEQEVIDIHHRHKLPPNPLYLRGASRVGCWPCIYARKEEIRLVAAMDPTRIDRLRVLESDVTIAARARVEAKGQQLANNLTFFSARGGATEAGWPIDKVVDWSRTAYGGKQYELFVDDHGGCVRWGLCDTGAKLGDK